MPIASAASPIGRERVGALDRGAAGELRVPQVRELVDPARHLLGVVDEALEPGGERHRVLLAIELDPLRGREVEVVPRRDPLRVQRPDQALVEQGLHLVRADLDDVRLEAARELRGRLLVGVEGRRLDLQVRVRLGDRVDHLRAHAVLVGEHVERPGDRRLRIGGRRRDAGIAAARAAPGSDRGHGEADGERCRQALRAFDAGPHLLNEFVTLVNNLSKSAICARMCTFECEFRADLTARRRISLERA